MVTERPGFWLEVQDSITLILAKIPPHGQLRGTGRAGGLDAVRVGGMETGSLIGVVREGSLGPVPGTERPPDPEDSEYRSGRMVFRGPDGSRVEIPLKIRNRGNFRLKKRTCSFPLLRLDLEKAKLGGTVLDGQNKITLVTHRPGRTSRSSTTPWRPRPGLSGET